MSNYHAVYDAAFRVLDCDLASRIQTALSDIVHANSRPSVLHRPQLYLDGNAWCALYGENIQEGVCAFGFSPEEAMRNFDVAWFQKLALVAAVNEKGGG